ncbi:unnamed protein product [Protopolystoma xenopodis]|uniref:Uncharacterized protein n=1 Tax=Protopolystoma xenopodis TaxID=117903 RepID=A0A3S5C6G1_9PLAT|nr:unnamed protein product [Protopolystoma xenopodis]
MRLHFAKQSQSCLSVLSAPCPVFRPIIRGPESSRVYSCCRQGSHLLNRCSDSSGPGPQGNQCPAGLDGRRGQPVVATEATSSRLGIETQIVAATKTASLRLDSICVLRMLLDVARAMEYLEQRQFTPWVSMKRKNCTDLFVFQRHN